MFQKLSWKCTRGSVESSITHRIASRRTVILNTSQYQRREQQRPTSAPQVISAILLLQLGSVFNPREMFHQITDEPHQASAGKRSLLTSFMTTVLGLPFNAKNSSFPNRRSTILGAAPCQDDRRSPSLFPLCSCFWSACSRDFRGWVEFRPGRDDRVLGALHGLMHGLRSAAVLVISDYLSIR